VLGERLPLQRVIGALAIVLGLAVIGSEALATFGTHGLLGDVLFMLAGGTFATFATLLRLWRVPATRATIVVSVVSIAILPIYGIAVGFVHMLALGAVENLLQALAQGVLAGPAAIWLFTRAVILLGASRASVFASLVPPCVLLIGALVLGTTPSLMQLVGLVIVLIGFRITQRG